MSVQKIGQSIQMISRHACTACLGPLQIDLMFIFTYNNYYCVFVVYLLYLVLRTCYRANNMLFKLLNHADK